MLLIELCGFIFSHQPGSYLSLAAGPTVFESTYKRHQDLCGSYFLSVYLVLIQDMTSSFEMVLHASGSSLQDQVDEMLSISCKKIPIFTPFKETCLAE